jgi:predicted transposase YdaD
LTRRSRTSWGRSRLTCNRLPLLPASRLNVDLSTLSAATDVAFGFGDPLQEIADLNFQSGPDRELAARMHLYNAAFFLKFQVPVRSILILLRPKADAPGLHGKLTYVCRDRRIRFEYDVIRLWKQPVEPFLKGGLHLLPLAPLCKMPPGKPLAEALREVVREIDRRLAEATDRPQAVRLMTAAFILTGMRVPKETLSSIYDGVRIMHESSAYDMILDEGRIEGRIEGEIKLVRLLGPHRFGSPSAKVEAALTAIRDLDRLERLAEAILTAKSWKELLATP